jgi:hypothetical protein
MAKLIVKSGQLAGTEIPLQAGVNSVGRNAANDICIPEPGISTSHCELDVAAIGISIHDLNSTNGTFINHERVARGMVQNGDLLTLGNTEFAVQVDEVHIGIPEVPIQEAPGAGFLEDGTPACFTHRDIPALFRCTKCENWWCGDCIRQIKRLSGDFMNFCPECSAACVALPQRTAATKRSFLQRVGYTLRLPRRK